MMILYRFSTGKFKDISTGHVPRLNACIPLIALLAVPVFLGGCAQFGPSALSAGRPLYNIAVQETESQQLLLNIVRQRYRDPVLFLDVTSISSGFSRQASAGWLGNTGSSNIGGTLGGSISESPFITYAPNTGEAFVRQMMTPLDITTLALIVQAGWSIERTLLIVGESVNELRNTPSDRNPQTGYLKFHEVVSSLRDLQRDGKLSLGAEMVKDDTEPRLSLLVAPDAVKSEPYLKVCKAIKVACDGRPLHLRQAIGASIDDETMVLATRSLFSAMYFLSQGVDVPEKDVASGVASRKSVVSGGPFDQAGTGETLFHIRTSAEEPELASVKVQYDCIKRIPVMRFLQLYQA
jgi:hypothetical protein